MSPQEIQLLQNFLDQLVQVQGVNKDPLALEMIHQAVSKQAAEQVSLEALEVGVKKKPVVSGQ